MNKPTAGKVLQTYYALRADRGTKPPVFFRKRTWAHAEAFLAWCEKLELEDPLEYLKFRFRAGDHGGYIPKLNQLRSNQLAELFKQEWMQGEIGLEHAYEELKAREGTLQDQTIRHLRLLTHGQEAVKHPYAAQGRPDLCLAQQDLSGGYHPESRYCPTCALAVRCAAALHQKYGFDVVALRAGRLRDLPREIAAAAIR